MPGSVAVVTDIHGDSEALGKVFAGMRALEADGGLLVAGDLLFSYRSTVDPIRALDMLMDQPILAAVSGNTDRWFIDDDLGDPELPAASPARAQLLALKRRLRPQHREFLSTLQHTRSLELWGHSLCLTHASPLSWHLGLTVDLDGAELVRRLAGVDSGYLITGHLHRSFARTHGALVQFAVGAVSRHPHEPSSGPEFAILAPSAAGLICAPQTVS